MILADLAVKIFGDGANLSDIAALATLPHIKGFTTNPTLMAKAGIRDYERFARQVVETVPDRPISFEVFSDDFVEMERQARKIATWGEHVYVKVPVTNTRLESACELVRRLSSEGVKINVTAVFSLRQVSHTVNAVKDGAPSYISVFAGRIADSGRDPVPHMKSAMELLHEAPSAELIWASPREVLNVVQANEVGCHIITVTQDILRKLDQLGKDLDQFSLETVRMFFTDAQAAGFQL